MNTLKNALVICVLSVIMINTEVSAQTKPAQQGGTYQRADLDAYTDKYCSEQSIRGSESAWQNAKREAQGMKSVMVPPEVKMLARIDLSIRTLELQNLIMSCAIVRMLDKGI